MYINQCYKKDGEEIPIKQNFKKTDFPKLKELLKKNGFEWVQGSTYMTMNDDLTALVKTVMELSKIEWFKKSVRDLRGFNVESWSNFTDLVKNS